MKIKKFLLYIGSIFLLILINSSLKDKSKNSHRII